MENCVNRLVLKRAVFALLVCFCSVFVCACAHGDNTDAGQPGENEYLVYYLDKTGRALGNELRSSLIASDNTTELLDELTYMMRQPEDAAHTSTFRDEMVIVDTQLNDEVLSVYFTDSYNKLSAEDEVMFRAAYVKTVTQIDGIKYVCFYVNEQPLMDALGKAVGIMLASDFMEDIGTGTYRTWVDLSLYYADANADKLVPEKITVGYGRDASIERVIIEQLIKGPGEENHLRTVPATLTLLGVNTKDGVCYVNFDSTLTDVVVPVTPAVTIYSIVNSLCELSTVNKVQISVKSNTNIMFRDTIDLSSPLERSLDIIDTQKN